MVRTRRIVQGSCLALVLVGTFGLQANCERWCPFGGVEAIYTYAVEGNMLCSLAVSNFFILGGVVLATLLLRRAFCGYLCPIGAISEWLWRAARALRLPAISVSAAWDRLLSPAKYIVLAAILYFTYRAGELVFRGFDPCYALISRHGEDITAWAYVVAGGIVIASLLIVLPFCRWLCPLAAVLNPFSRVAVTGVQRDAASCTDCARCRQRCPMNISVDAVQQVTAARCIACLECLHACPGGAGRPAALQWGPTVGARRRWPSWLLVVLLIACTGGAVAASYLVPIPSFVRQRGQPVASPASVELLVEDLTCRGRANLFAYFLERDDLFAVPGYLQIAAWPGPGLARVVITYDPARADEAAIKRAITEPYFESESNFWRPSPFRIDGYDPLAELGELGLGLDPDNG